MEPVDWGDMIIVSEETARSLYAPKQYRMGRWARIKVRLRVSRYRIVNAWLVLIGRAFVE